MLILWICVIIGAGVYRGAMITAIVKFPEIQGRRARQVHA